MASPAFPRSLPDFVRMFPDDSAMSETKMTAVDAALDTVAEDESPAEALVAIIADEDWMRSDDLDDKYAVIESSGAVWYVHEDDNGNADCRRCATWDEARALLPDGVS